MRILSETNLSQADLSHAYFWEANLSAAQLHLASLIEADLRGASLYKADLSLTDLRGADFSEAWLYGANLSRAQLFSANLTAANLSDADLRDANLGGADLRGVDLCGADLTGANLKSTYLSNAKLDGADLSGARVWHTLFAGLNLSLVKGLETVRHRGPSTIGIDTIYNSQGKIPEVFLRGCGLSDIQIEMVKLHNPDLTSEQMTDITYKIHELYVAGAVRFYSCFISYSSQDQGFADRLHADLQDKGVRCWFAPDDMRIGDKLRPAIDQAIRIHDKLMLILSEHSVASGWVESEVETALEREQERGKTVLFPVRLDDTVMELKTGWPALIKRTRHIGDFRAWKDHDAYQGAFERLLRDLKEGEGREQNAGRD